LLTAALGLAVASRIPARREERDRLPEPPPSGRISVALAAGTVIALAAYTPAAAWRAAGAPSTGNDTLTFHLPNVASWIQGGSLWQVDQFQPIWALGNYPHNGDVLSLASVLPWTNDAFAQLVNVPFIALLVLAVYAIGLELGAPRATALIFACLVPAAPNLTDLAYAGTQPDVILVAAFSGGVLFLVRAARTGRASDLVLGGLGLGLAFGAKWNGVADALAVLAVFAVALAVARRPPRAVLRASAVAGGTMLAAGGFWLLRNLVKSANPIIPVKVEVAGLTVFDAPPDEVRACVGHTVAEYLDSPDILVDYVWPGLRGAVGWPGLACTLALIAALAVVVARRGRDGRAAGLVAATLVLIAVYTITPYSALGHEGEPVLVLPQARYLLPALALGAGVGAWAAGRLGPARIVAEALAVMAVFGGLLTGFEVAGPAWAGAAVVLAAGVAAWHFRAVPRSPRVARVAAAVLVLALVAVGHERQRDFNDRRYAGSDSEPALLWIYEHAPRDQRVAIAGAWDLTGLAPILPAFGPDLDNELEYVAREDQGVLREYTSRADWASAVRGGDFDLLIVARGGYDRRCPLPGSETDEEAWARAEGFPILAESHRLVLHRVTDSPARPGDRGLD
jgi:hypothetical protein